MRRRFRLVFLTLCLATLAVPSPADLDPPVRYEGDVDPDLATPVWTPFRVVGGVVADIDAEDGLAYELDARASRMSWHMGDLYNGGLEAMDNTVGWVVVTRHKAIFNDKPSLNPNRFSDQNDTLFVFDGVMSMSVDFRPGEVRVQTRGGSPNACEDRPLHCVFVTVPRDEYVEVRLHGQGTTIEVYVDDVGPFVLQAHSVATVRELIIGSTVTGSFGGSLARWDYVRVHTGGPFLPPVVMIDIKPGSDPNSVNPRSRGKIPVAVLGSVDFDVRRIAVDTIVFGPADASPAHRGHDEDVNDDGFADLVLHFATQDTGIQRGDSEACMAGTLLDGSGFESCDAVRTVGR